MDRGLWQLLLLLLGLRVSGDAPDCSNASQKVTVQLSRTHILRTWQPDGAHCRWWENRQSETNQFPAAVRSGPRWLVMQLRQPMMLEEVNVRDWDGQWQAAALVGSPVSALGASSLPLELQLQDPCRTPLEAFNSSDRWRQLEGQPVSFILLASPQPLQWNSLSLTGRIVPMQLKETRNPFCLNCEPLTWRHGDTIGFSVSSCGSHIPNCWVRMADGGLNKVAMFDSRQGADSSRISHFEYSMVEIEIPRTLECWQGDSAALRIGREIALVLLVSGRPGFVEFVWHGVFPEPKIQCLIRASSDVALKYLGQIRSVLRDEDGRVLVSVRSKFAFTATNSMIGGQIVCCASFSGRENSVAMEVRKELNITNISEPCQTEVVLGSSRYSKVGDTWRITVTSRNCSIWNVCHSCRLLAYAASSVAHCKVQQGSFSSAHELQVSRSMALQNWSVRCSVNQSGVMHDEAESLEELQRLIFYPANINVRAITEYSQVFLAVTGSDCRPPVSAVTCFISISSEATISIRLNNPRSSEKWSFSGTVPAPLWTASSSNKVTVAVNCTALQVFNSSRIFQELNNNTSVEVYCGRLSHLIVASTFIVAIMAVIAIISSMITWKVSLSRLQSERQRKDGGTAVSTRPLPLTAAASAGAGSSAYDYPMAESAPPGSSAYDYPMAETAPPGSSAYDYSMAETAPPGTSAYDYPMAETAPPGTSAYSEVGEARHCQACTWC